MSHHHHHHGDHGHCHHHHHHSHSMSFRWIFEYSWKAREFEDAKELLVFTCFLLGSGMYEIILGAVHSDLSLLSEGFHTWFHSLCVWAAFLALSYENIHANPDKKCSFGYERVQIVTAFGNSIFALFIALFEIFEIFHEISTGKHIDSEPEVELFLIVKLIAEGIACYYLKDYGKTILERTPKQENFGVILIHILGLLAVDFIKLIGAAFKMHELMFPLNLLDSILLVGWLVFMMYMLWPYITRNARILLLCSPTERQKEMIVKKMREVSFIEGVAQVKDEKIWMLSSKKIVGSVTLRVHEDADCLAITETASEKLKEVLHVVNVEVTTEAESS